ncbi:hypothetical protein OAL71_03350, partial [Phycisphaerales bacterium]|nr:hypothetical protein [Phycisphaerales bacterium]
SVEGILIEHRATEICVELIQELKTLSQPVSPRFRSIGGAIDEDVYKLPPCSPPRCSRNTESKR